MIFNAAFLLIIGILIGIIIGFLVSRPMIRQKILDVENYWKKKILDANQNLSGFHKQELTKWQEATKVLINQTYNDAVNERDRAWRQKFEGTKSVKPKPSSN
jgi:hypothetical protein